MRLVTPDMLGRMDINGDGQLGIDEWVINILALEESTSDEDFTASVRAAGDKLTKPTLPSPCCVPLHALGLALPPTRAQSASG